MAAGRVSENAVPIGDSWQKKPRKQADSRQGARQSHTGGMGGDSLHLLNQMPHFVSFSVVSSVHLSSAIRIICSTQYKVIKARCLLTLSIQSSK